MKNGETKKVSAARKEDLLGILKARFGQNPGRHAGVKWEDVMARLVADPVKLWSISEMERTGGEPDVIGCEQQSGEYLIADCSPETPAGRRSVCYDREGLESRKEHRPENSAIDLAAEMGIVLLTEEEYFALQKLGEFDTKTSSWLNTPADFRRHGSALFGDCRHGRVFIYQNGAQSYYKVRGFRGLLRL